MSLSKAITISASGMESFFKCQHQFLLSRQLSPVEPVKPLEIGNMAHLIMSGQKVNEESDYYSPAVAYTNSFNSAIQKYGFNILYKELKQNFEIQPGVNLVRIIDAIVEYHGETILVDWKTAEKGTWSRVPKAKMADGFMSVSPKAMGFQAQAYLTPPPKIILKMIGLETWPTTILFVVGNQLGSFQINGYGFNSEDDDNFKLAAFRMAEVIERGHYVKSRGYTCGDWGSDYACPMMAACYQVKGWEEMFKKREYTK